MVKLSILIAASDKALLEASLVSILQSRPANCELVVLHDDRFHDQYDLSGEVRFVQESRGTGELERLNRGISLCQAPIIHVLRCGAEVEDGWADAALAHFADPSIAAVAPLVVTSGGQRVECAGIDYRPEGARVPRAHDQLVSNIGIETAPILGPALDAAFYRASVLQNSGEIFCPSLGSELADVDLALRLARAGHRAVLEQRSRVVAAPKSRALSPLAAAWLAERLYWRHRRDYGLRRAVVGHMRVVAFEAARSVVRPLESGRLIGRTAGWMEHLLFGRQPLDKERFENPPSRQDWTRVEIDGPAAGAARINRRRSAARAA